MEKLKKELQKVKIQEKEFSKEILFRILLDYIILKFLDYMKPNSEYDILLVIKRLQLVIHIEVKSLSIDGVLAPAETKRYHFYSI